LQGDGVRQSHELSSTLRCQVESEVVVVLNGVIDMHLPGSLLRGLVFGIEQVQVVSGGHSHSIAIDISLIERFTDTSCIIAV
jgi:hypothetical protein